MAEIPDLATAVHDSNQKVTEVQEKLAENNEEMMYSFMGVLVAAIAIGMALGGCLILCCLKLYQRGQGKRLAQANRAGLRFTEPNETEFNTRTMPCVQTIPDEEKPEL